ncbi:hypothetical protein E2C01_031768 [Portunus trituberculatus]|uniref:Uncharacterized protein n=1 Tax=Portunus trituberculatus TaxID=210409 RepID=A0A5B7EZH2_PORTR|nr:hypothetical protein [Portunus trituberculatus]
MRYQRERKRSSPRALRTSPGEKQQPFGEEHPPEKRTEQEEQGWMKAAVRQSQGHEVGSGVGHSHATRWHQAVGNEETSTATSPAEVKAL